VGRRPLRIDPTNADIYNNLGNVLAMQGRSDDARSRYETALRYDPAFAQAHENPGRLLVGAQLRALPAGAS
jgi:Flp pilus assembly protein TadD